MYQFEPMFELLKRFCNEIDNGKDCCFRLLLSVGLLLVVLDKDFKNMLSYYSLTGVTETITLKFYEVKIYITLEELST